MTAAPAAELARLLSSVTFTRRLGLRLHHVGAGECALEVPFQRAFERPGGIVSGQVLMAAADVAMWLAIMTRLGLTDGSVTAEMHTAFLGAARGEAFRCTARILKLGRRLIYGVAECVSASGTLLTHSTLSYARPDSASAPSPRPSRAGRRAATSRARPRGRRPRSART
jgi:uncharacterized protein (TIGR00369 family)